MAVRFASRSITLSRGFRLPDLRSFSSEASVKCTMHVKSTKLHSRALVKVEGQDSVKCLHGLVTNDLELFHHDEDWNAMYAMFLNASGRILHDVIFYKNKSSEKDPSFLVECDASAVTDVMRHLKVHKLRAKIDVSRVSDIIPWVVFSSTNPFELKSIPNKDVFTCVKDPRLRELGYRVLVDRNGVLSSCFEDLHEADEEAYNIHRSKLGVCEGVQEMPPGSALPLEFNLAYLNGVSFHKGCYIGQELTARTYHTGVIRKRVVPFTVQGSAKNITVQEGNPVITSSGKKAGKVCAFHGQYGMGVVRLELVKSEEKLFVEDGRGNGVEVSADLPSWWPKESQ